jgi:tetrahydromethanopterin S-methyltransferase subunit G
MSRADDRSNTPSNSELAERTARIEANVEHVAKTVDRIEEQVATDHDELGERIEENSEKVETVYTYHQAIRYGLPLLGAAGSFLGGFVALGVI